MKKGFKGYGLIGAVIIFLSELNFIFKIEPFASWYFPIIWSGYIMIIDSLIFKIKGNSLISNRLRNFFGMVIISSLFWWVFEFTNIFLSNWSYHGVSNYSNNVLRNLFGTLSFATILPALFETTELIRTFSLFEKNKLKKSYRITRKFLYSMIFFGLLFFLLPVVFPEFAFPLIWLSFFFFLDPINYLNDQPSIIECLRNKRLAIPFSLLLAGIILGFFWEFWNYWAVPKWTYNIPYVGFLKIFEMPLLGYLGYFPFAFELYAMYWFVRSLFLKKERFLIN